jgi:hypothetical protein
MIIARLMVTSSICVGAFSPHVRCGEKLPLYYILRRRFHSIRALAAGARNESQKRALKIGRRISMEGRI